MCSHHKMVPAVSPGQGEDWRAGALCLNNSSKVLTGWLPTPLLTKPPGRTIAPLLISFLQSFFFFFFFPFLSSPLLFSPLLSFPFLFKAAPEMYGNSLARG